MNDLEIVVVSLTSEYMSNDSENSFFFIFYVQRSDYWRPATTAGLGINKTLFSDW